MTFFVFRSIGYKQGIGEKIQVQLCKGVWNSSYCIYWCLI